MKSYKVSKKIDGKWLGFGNVKPSSFNEKNLQLGMRCTALFKQMVADAEEGTWLNFAMFEQDEKQRSDGNEG